jgi:hypothetical protein
MSKARDLANAGTALTTVSATELGYLDGVTSSVQTQIDSKIGSASAINPTIVDAKGDIIAATAADTVSRLAIGANDTVLTADSTAATGLKWATPSAGGMTSIASGSLSTGTVTISSIPGTYKYLFLYIRNVWESGGNQLRVRLNGNTSAIYGFTQFDGSSLLSTGSGANYWNLGDLSSTTVANSYSMNVYNYADSNTYKSADMVWARGASGSHGGNPTMGFGSTTAVTSLSILLSAGTFGAGGTYILYGVS